MEESRDVYNRRLSDASDGQRGCCPTHTAVRKRKVLQKRANHIAAVRINVLRILYRAARLCSPLVLKVMDLISFSHNNEHDTPV
jgi:hypothetical protein